VHARAVRHEPAARLAATTGSGHYVGRRADRASGGLADDEDPSDDAAAADEVGAHLHRVPDQVGRGGAEVPMRVVVAGALMMLLIEVLLGLAFWGGWVWPGGPAGGVTVAAVAALALALFVAGELQFAFDSGSGLIDVRAGWIAHVTVRPEAGGDGRELRSRVLFVSWPRRLDWWTGRGLGVAPRRGSARDWFDAVRRGGGPLVRVLTAAATALGDLVLDANELSLRVDAPTQVATADRMLAGWIGVRRLGPAALEVAEGDERRLVVHYRIGLLRAALTLLAARVQGQPQQVARIFRRRRAAQPFDAPDAREEASIS